MIWIIASAVLLLILIAYYVMQRGYMAIFRWKKHPHKGQIRIVCAGDSITYGYGVRSWTKNCYPAKLDNYLGEKYCVQNCGVCGATASVTGDCPYEKTSAYTQSLAFSPDIVLLMLGTNDSKPNNWKGKDAYTDNLKRLIASYLALPKTPRIILMTPPPAWGDPVAFDIDADVIKTEIRSVVIALAKELNAGYIDLYKEADGHPELFWDGVHPNAEGADKIADAAAAYLQKELKK